jgi:hypothetical protein
LDATAGVQRLAEMSVEQTERFDQAMASFVTIQQKQQADNKKTDDSIQSLRHSIQAIRAHEEVAEHGNQRHSKHPRERSSTRRQPQEKEGPEGRHLQSRGVPWTLRKTSNVAILVYATWCWRRWS